MSDAPNLWPEADSLEISPHELLQIIGAGQEFRLIDCREEEEWQFCRLGEAELVPLSRFSELFAKRFTDPAEKIVVYCHHGMRSQHATYFLRQKGFPYTWSLAGGIDLWSRSIDPTVPRY